MPKFIIVNRCSENYQLCDNLAQVQDYLLSEILDDEQSQELFTVYALGNEVEFEIGVTLKIT